MAPLKRIAPLQPLSEDHHNALVIALRCKRLAVGKYDADPTEFWRGVHDFFELQVLPHFEVEEELLLPELRRLGETAMADRIESEHRQLRELLIEAVPDSQGFEAFGNLLDDHIRFEERTVFEDTQHRFSETALAAIETASNEVPQICPTTFKRLPRADRS